MADREHNEVGWEIVRAVVMIRLSAFRAAVRDLQEAPE